MDPTEIAFYDFFPILGMVLFVLAVVVAAAVLIIKLLPNPKLDSRDSEPPIRKRDKERDQDSSD